MSLSEVLRFADLPDGAVNAAAAFLRQCSGKIRLAFDQGAELVIIVFPAAPYDHDDWRRATARDLAREYAPHRVVIVAGGGEIAVAATVEFLGNAPGVTGQFLKLDG